MVHDAQQDEPNRLATLRQRAEAWLRSNPAELSSMPVDDVQLLIHELNINHAELEIQNEELRQAQVELAQTRDRYVDLYEFAPVGYVTMTRDGSISEANLSAATMLGVGSRPGRPSPKRGWGPETSLNSALFPVSTYCLSTSATRRSTIVSSHALKEPAPRSVNRSKLW